MRIKWGQDLATGLLFIAIGLGALIIGWDYPRGTPQRPGTGVLPLALSWCLIGTGGILATKSIASGDSEITGINWRALFLVTLLFRGARLKRRVADLVIHGAETCGLKRVSGSQAKPRAAK